MSLQQVLFSLAVTILQFRLPKEGDFFCTQSSRIDIIITLFPYSWQVEQQCQLTTAEPTACFLVVAS